MKPLIREAKPSDMDFIYSTWLRAYYDLMNRFHKPSKTVFFKEHQTYIKKLVEKSDCYIVCNEEDTDQIISYMVAEPNTLHFIYTKNVFRQYGFARMLLNLIKPVAYTHHTSYIKHLKMNATYNPYYGEFHASKNQTTQDSTVH